MKKKEEKKTELSKYTKRQLKLLSQYHEIDYENRIITVTFKGDSIDEYLDLSLSSTEKPCFSKVLLGKISDFSHSVPVEFVINVKLDIKDYKGYDPKDLLNGISDSFEVFAYDMRVESNKISSRTSTLILIGVTLFIWLFALCALKLFGKEESASHNLLHELVFAVGSALLWQAVYFIFLPQDDYSSILYSVLKRVKKIDLCNGVTLLASVNEEEMKKDWLIEKKNYIYARKLVLAVGTGLLCLASYDITEIILTALSFKGEANQIASIIIQAICVVFLILYGMGAMSLYYGKGPFKKAVPIFGSISVLLTMLSSVGYIIDMVQKQDPSQSNIVGLIVNIILVALSVTLLVSSVALIKLEGEPFFFFNKKSKKA